MGRGRKGGQRKRKQQPQQQQPQQQQQQQQQRKGGGGPGDGAGVKLEFPGEVVYARTAGEVDEAVRRVREQLRHTVRHATVMGVPEASARTVGFDAEWRPQFNAGGREPPVALLQVATRFTVFLLHIHHSGATPALRGLLADAGVVKAGVGVEGDARRLREVNGVALNGWLSLSEAANGVLPAAERRAKWGLAALCERLTGLGMAKAKKVQLSNWEQQPLNERQKRYAAADAYAGLLIEQALRVRPLPGRPLASHKCPQCDYKAASAELVHRHQVDAQHTFVCPWPGCGGSFYLERERASHRRKTGHEFECPFDCGRSFGSVDALRAHQRGTGHLFSCGECDARTFFSHGDAYAHRANRCCPGLACPRCSHMFPTREALHEHQRAAQHLFKCPLCPAAHYTSRGPLILEHFKNEHHVCSQCNEVLLTCLSYHRCDVYNDAPCFTA